MRRRRKIKQTEQTENLKSRKEKEGEKKLQTQKITQTSDRCVMKLLRARRSKTGEIVARLVREKERLIARRMS